MPDLKTNFMIFWKEFFTRKGKASLPPILFAPSGRMIGRPWGTHTSLVESFVSLLTFLSTTSTFVLGALFSGRLLVYQWAPIVPLCWLISSFIPSSTISWSKPWKVTLQKPSSSAIPFVTSTIYSVLTMWTLVITSAQFTRQNCNLRTLPHLLLKCVISTHISRQAIQPHLSVSASTIREMTLHSGLSTFLIWTATFPPIQLTVFIYLNWWDMLEFALPKLTSWIDSADFPYVSDNKVFSPIYFSEHLQNSSIGMILSSWNMVQPCGRWDLPSRLE